MREISSNSQRAPTNKPIASIILNGERLNVFPLTSEIRQQRLLPPLLYNTVLKVLAIAVRQKKEIQGIPIGKEDTKLFLFPDGMTVHLENAKESSNQKKC